MFKHLLRWLLGILVLHDEESNPPDEWTENQQFLKQESALNEARKIIELKQAT